MTTDEKQQVTVDVGWAGRHLDHGYAMTCHKAQGATVDTALLYGAGALTREGGYVALSRGRTENHVYVPETADNRGVGLEPEPLDQLAARLAIRPDPDPRHPPAAASSAWELGAQSQTTPRARTLRRDLPMNQRSIEELPPTIDLLTAAELLGIGRTAAYRLVREARWPTPVVRAGRLIRIPTAPLLAAIGLTIAPGKRQS